MPINDTETPRTPGWWMRRLARKLNGRQARLEMLDKWFRGEPPLPIGAENCAEAYRIFQRKCRSNFAELSVEAARERITPIGIRLRGSQDDDEEGWAIYRANGLDVEFADVLTNMLSLGDAYTITGLVDNEPVITSEDPRQVVTAHDPVRQRRVVASLKLFHDDTEDLDLAYLYVPGALHVASRRRRVTRSPYSVRFSPSSFDWDEERSSEFAPDLTDLMPVVRFRNKRGVGEFEPHIDLLDRINHTILQRMTIATLQAFKQRAIKVDPVDMPDKDPDTGKVIDYDEVFTADPGALWKLPQTAELWESGQVDLTPVLSAIKDDVNHFAAVTRTPMHYLEPGGENQSAEGAALSREGLVFRCGDRITRADDGLRQTFANAFRMRNKPGDQERSDPAGLEILWAPVERYSLIERAAALVQAEQGGVPFRTRMIEVWGATPAGVDRMESERIDDMLLAPELGTNPPTPPAA